MRSELAATAEQAAGYRNENAGLAASEQSIKARTEQILASHASEMQERVLQAVKTCDERHKREDAPKSVSRLRSFPLVTLTTPSQNELKRLNNKLEDATKKLQKALTELAKAKSASSFALRLSTIPDASTQKPTPHRSSHRFLFSRRARVGPASSRSFDEPPAGRRCCSGERSYRSGEAFSSLRFRARC